MHISSCDNVLITGLKEAANVLIAVDVADVADVADDAADITFVDVAIDEADTVINCACSTSDILLFGVGTKSSMFGLRVLRTMMEHDCRGSNCAEMFLFCADERCCLRI